MFRPVRMLARQGLHLGLLVKQFENSTPSRATRSNPGVLIQRQPYAPAWPYDQSSEITNKMFGRFASSARTGQRLTTSRQGGRRTIPG